LIPLLLAVYAIWNRIRRRATPGPIGFLAIAVIVSLILAFGWFTPIYPSLYNAVPGFNLFQGPARWLVVTVVALCACGIWHAASLNRGVSRNQQDGQSSWAAALSLPVWRDFVLRRRVKHLVGHSAVGRHADSNELVFRSDLPINGYHHRLVVALDLITAHFALNPTLPADVYHAENRVANAIEADGSIGRVFTFAQDEEQIKFGKYLAHNTGAGKQQFDGFGPNDLDYWLNERAALLPNVAMIDGLPSANNSIR
jgi:hypothetical protein